MKKIKVAILGQGRSGRDIHGKNLVKMQDRFTIAAISDPLDERRLRAIEEYNCDTYQDYRDLLKRTDIDLIINATPSHMHAPVTGEFLNAGFHVVCEKPLARTVKEVDSLIEASRRSGKILSVFQQSRYAPAFKQIRKVIESGALGRIIQINISYSGFARRWDWQTLQTYNGGNLLNTGPHPVDQALQLFGTDTMPNITCFMDRVNTSGDAEDYVKLLLNGEGRPIIDIEISSCNAYPSYTYHIQGSRGGLKGSTTHLEWKYYNPENEEKRELVDTPLMGEDGIPVYCREQLKWVEESWDIPESQGKDLFGTMTSEFYDMLYKTLILQSPLEITPQEVRQQIAVMEECHRQNTLALSRNFGLN